MAKRAENKRIFSDLLRKHVEDSVKPKLLGILNNVAKWMVGLVDESFRPFEYYGGGNVIFPVWDSHLRDATGVGIYVDGALTAYKPTRKGLAKNPQSYNGDDNIIGSERLDDALKAASGEFSNGIWIVLFSAVPYAYKVNYEGSPRGRGVEFFDTLEETLKLEVFANLKPLGTQTT